VLREAGAIAPAMLRPLTPHEQIFDAFSHYLREERGLATKSIVHHLPFIRLFLREVCPGGTSDLGKIRQADVTRCIERHARDWSAASGKAMCWALRSFLRYLHHKGLNPFALAGCVPSIRRWKLASLPTYLSAVQVQTVLDGCDRATALGRRDYAILMMLAKLGGDPARFSFAPRAGSERGCQSLQTSARLSLPTCVMVARSRRVADYFSAHWLPTSASHPVARSQ